MRRDAGVRLKADHPEDTPRGEERRRQGEGAHQQGVEPRLGDGLPDPVFQRAGIQCGQLAIDLPEPRRGGVQDRGARRVPEHHAPADDVPAAGHEAVSVQPIEDRLGRTVHPVFVDVSHDPDDLAHTPQFESDRRVRQIPLDEALVDDRYRRRIRPITLLEHPPVAERDSQGPEVPRRDAAEQGSRHLIGIGDRLLADALEADDRPLPAQGKRVHDPRVGDAGDRRQRLADPVEERGLSRGVRIPVGGDLHLEGHGVLGLVPGRCAHEGQETPGQQTRADQQRKREGELEGGKEAPVSDAA